MKQTKTRGKTSFSLPVFIADTSSTTGGGLSGVTSASSGLVLEYRRQGQSSWTSVTPQAGKTLGSYLSGGIVADGSLSGAYEVDFPDAAFASAAGVEWVACRIRGVTNMLPVLIEVQLDVVDYQTDAFGALKPTTAGRTLDVSAGGEAGIDLANVGSPTTTLNLSGTTISTSQAVASVSGNVGGNVVGSVGSISGVTFPTHFSNLVISANGHVTATVDSINNNAITASSIQANAFTAAKFSADSITATALATDAVSEIANAVAATQALSRLDSMIESDGAGQFRFDIIALENAPSGGGGGGTDWNSNERSAIRSIFGFDSSGNISIPSVGVLDAIKDKTDLITTGTIQSSIPVTQSGQITGPLFIGDDYLSVNGRAFQWTVALPTGFVIATSTCRFGMEHAEGATEGASFAVSGTVTDAGGGNVTLAFSVPKATTGALKAGFYRWSVEIASAGGNEVTRVASDGKKLVEWREKQT